MSGAFDKRIVNFNLLSARVPVNVRLRACRNVRACAEPDMVAHIERTYVVRLRFAAASADKTVKFVVGNVSAVSLFRGKLRIVVQFVFVVIDSFVIVKFVLQEGYRLVSRYYKVGLDFVEKRSPVGFYLYIVVARVDELNGNMTANKVIIAVKVFVLFIIGDILLRSIPTSRRRRSLPPCGLRRGQALFRKPCRPQVQTRSSTFD